MWAHFCAHMHKKGQKDKKKKTANWKVRMNRGRQNVWLRGKNSRPRRSCTYVRHSLQTVCPAATGHRSYSGLLYRRAPTQRPASVCASQGHRVTFPRLSGILPPGWTVRVCVCTCAHWTCLSCHKLHSVTGAASQPERR